jgi:sortase A
MNWMARTAGVWGFGMAGALLSGFCAYRILNARFFQARESMHLEEMLGSESPRNLPVVPERRPPRKAGSLVGRLEIPRLHMSAMVLEGADDRTLDLGIGRISETADPGQAGNVALGGHRDTFFRPLRGIRRGDEITMTTPAGRFRYRVDWTKVVRPEDTGVLLPTAEPALTLVTCYPFRYIGPAPERFIVRARQY